MDFLSAIEWDILGSDGQTASVLAVFDISASGADERTLLSNVDIFAIGTQPGSRTDLTLGGQVVPKPLTLAQLGLGLSMLAFSGRRRSPRS